MHLVDAKVGGALLLHLPLHVHLDQAGGSDLVVHHPWGKNTVKKRSFQLLDSWIPKGFRRKCSVSWLTLAVTWLYMPCKTYWYNICHANILIVGKTYILQQYLVKYMPCNSQQRINSVKLQLFCSIVTRNMTMSSGN